MDNKSITITNDFHGTEYHLRKTAGDTVSAATLYRVRRALCGVAGCTCGLVDGSRHSHYHIEDQGPDSKAFSSMKQLPAHVRDAGDYTNWVYPDDGLVNFYAQSFPSCDDALVAAGEIINRNGAKQINIVHSPSGSILHTWERGSWRYGK